MDSKKASKSKYWYKIDVYECLLCGVREEFRERKYTKRPTNRSDRLDYHESYCGCLDRDNLRPL